MRKLILVFTIAFSAIAVSAGLPDSWDLPEKRTICSDNDRFCFKVIPKKLSSQLDYFSDKVDGKPNAGAKPKAKKNYCRGIFYRRDSRGFLSKVWETKLANEVSPVDVIVSDKGDYVVTFDNWHRVGYGDNVVAIYSANTGKLVRKLGLEDFLTDSDISALPRSVSSIWWSGEHRFDYSSGELVLQISKSRKVWDKDAEFVEVRLNLGTGEPVGSKVHRLPSLRYVIAASDSKAEIPEELIANASKVCPGVPDQQLLSTSEMSSRIVDKAMPEYTPAARAVGARGTIVLKISVSEDGTPRCVKWVSGHPLLVKRIADAVEQWRFSAAPEAYGGYLVFEANTFTVRPDGTVVR